MVPQSNSATEKTCAQLSGIFGIMIHWRTILVGGWALPLWKIMDFVSWDHEIPNWMGENIKFHGSKPPTSNFIILTQPPATQPFPPSVDEKVLLQGQEEIVRVGIRPDRRRWENHDKIMGNSWKNVGTSREDVGKSRKLVAIKPRKTGMRKYGFTVDVRVDDSS